MIVNTFRLGLTRQGLGVSGAGGPQFALFDIHETQNYSARSGPESQKDRNTGMRTPNPIAVVSIDVGKAKLDAPIAEGSLQRQFNNDKCGRRALGTVLPGLLPAPHRQRQAAQGRSLRCHASARGPTRHPLRVRPPLAGRTPAQHLETAS